MAASMTPSYRLLIDTRVHRVDGEGANQELIISTHKDVNLTVLVVDNHHQILTSAAMPLSASLLYENGQPVEHWIEDHQQAMKGGVRRQQAMTGGVAHMTNGTATFKLRVNVLSSLRQHQKFRIRVAAMDIQLGKLEVITSPMRTIMKNWHTGRAVTVYGHPQTVTAYGPYCARKPRNTHPPRRNPHTVESHCMGVAVG